MKHCSGCNIDKDLSEFSRVKDTKDRHRSKCKSCRAIRAREKRKCPKVKARIKKYKQNPKNKKRTKSLALKRKFGITIEDYEKILDSQNGVCFICFGKEATKRSLAVDHCHSTGKVRGLLCTNCNRGIGHLKDNVLFLERAIKYLKENGV